MDSKGKSKRSTNSLVSDFDRIYLLYYARMCRFVKEYTLSIHDAEDIVQEVFATVWKNRSSIDFGENISSFLLKAAKNKCIDYIRHKSTESKYKEQCAVCLRSLERIPDYDMSESDLDLLLRSAIEKLPPRCREVFIKSRYDDMKNSEIAKEMHISESTVENQMTIALSKIRTYLKDYLPILVFFL